MRLLRVVLGFNLASMRLLLTGDLRSFARACTTAYFLMFRAPPREPVIPGISLQEIVGDRRFELTITTRLDDGSLPTEQVVVLLSVLLTEAPSEVLEIGTFMGETASAMARALPSATIHTVDLPQSDPPVTGGPLPKDDIHLIAKRAVGREFKGKPWAGRILQHFGDTATWDFKEAGHPTFFFIDGSHTYEYCKNDSEKCFELCGGKGVFLWHDCDANHPGVAKFLEEWRTQGRDIRRIYGTSIAYLKSAG